MALKPTQYAAEVYNTAQWSQGYFAIDASGEVCVTLPPAYQAVGPSLATIVAAARQAGARLPLLLRFNHILRHRVTHLHQAFAQAFAQTDYRGQYTSVYPIKVNQQASIITEFLSLGTDKVGLEAGSKPELLAVLGLIPEVGAKIICNGYKDDEFIRIALIARKLGHNIFLCIEKISELERILAIAEELSVTPYIAIRFRLAAIASGKWQNSGGEKAKFGLTVSQVLAVVERLRALNRLDALRMVHFHMGSQIANIHDIDAGLQEAARHFVELKRLGVPIDHLNVGGGLGIDYEGTQSRSDCSMNYSITEYARHVVTAFANACQQNGFSHPHIITESGRAMVAHHAVLICQISDEEVMATRLPEAKANEPAVVAAMRSAFATIMQRPLLESQHDLSILYKEVQTRYQHGLLTLAERGVAEEIYLAANLAIQAQLDPQVKPQRALLDDLNEKLATKLFCNFSLFRSLPDVWAIEQVFPVMPLSHLDQPLDARAVIQDITCDSDGRIDYYVDGQSLECSLSIPSTIQTGDLMGVFLVGAYQETLGDIHNLFGATDAVHVSLSADGAFTISAVTPGDTVTDVLAAVNIDGQILAEHYKAVFAAAQLDSALLDVWLGGLNRYTYLEA